MTKEIKPCVHEKIPELGMCKHCYMLLKKREKYANDSEYRETKQAKGRKYASEYIKKKCESDKDFNARKQREFRHNHPDSFNFVMARYYCRKLTPENKQKLLNEVEGLVKHD
jgi:Trm5-related predicted tRNA methylase